MSNKTLEQIIEEEEARMDQPSTASDAARGFVQGASMGFGDEIKGAIRSIGADPRAAYAMSAAMPISAIPYLQAKAIEALARKGGGEIANRYRAERDIERMGDIAASERSPTAYTVGNVAGGVAGVAIPGAAPSSIARAAAYGAGSGAAQAIGESEADITSGDVAGAGIDTAIGAGVGAVSGLVPSAIKSAGRGAMRKFFPKMAAQKEATREASKLAEEVVGSDFDKTGRQFYGESMELQDIINKEIGSNEFKFTPAQSTGSRSAALTESVASQSPETIDKYAKIKQSQKNLSEKFLDAKVRAIAANPELLGAERVGKSIGDAIERRVNDLRIERSQSAKPFYDTFDKIAGKEGIKPLGAISALEEEIAGIGSGAGKQAAAKLRETLDLVKKGASLKDISAEMSYWSNASKAEGTALDQLGPANKKRIAGRIAAALSDDIDKAADGFGRGPDGKFLTENHSKAAEALKQGRSIWREYSEKIDDEATETVARMLKVADTDASDTIVGKLRKASPQQVRGVFAILNRHSPDVAANTRAQALEEIFVKARKQPLGSDKAASEIEPGRLYSILRSDSSNIDAMFEGDKKALEALKQTKALMQRLKFGPGLQGSQTAPMALEVARKAGMAVADKAAEAAGPQAVAAKGILKSIFSTDAAAAKAVSTPEGIEAFNEVMRSQIAGKKSDEKALKAAILTLNKLIVPPAIGAVNNE